MHTLTRPLLVVLVVALSASSSGCLANMGDLKETLGFVDAPAPKPEPSPEPLPPIARASTNVTLTLTGHLVRFSGEGSRDPDGAIVAFAWDFGDGLQATGRSATHAFAAPGEYRVTLTVHDADGLAANDSVTVTVRAPNLPPSAAFDVRDARGRSVLSGDAGAPLDFSAAESTDPEGEPLVFDWDFGNGATSHAESAKVTYDKPGQYLVNLTVRDAGGLAAAASRIVAQNQNLSWPEESFPATSGQDAKKTHAFTVPEGLSVVRVTLVFPTGFGANDLDLAVTDAAGKEVTRAQDPTSPGDSGDKTKALTLTPDILKGVKSGEWKVVVTKLKGVQVEYSLSSSVRY